MNQEDASPLRSDSPCISSNNNNTSGANKNRRRRRKPKSNSTGNMVTTEAQTPPRSTTTTATSTSTTPVTTTSTDLDDFFFSTPKKTTPILQSNMTAPNHAISSNSYINYSSSSPNVFQDSKYRHSNSNNSNRSGSKHSNQHQHHHHHEPADMTVIVNRVDLWDAASKFITPNDQHPFHTTLHAPHCAVAPYHFAPDMACWLSASSPAGAAAAPQFHSSSSSSSTQQHESLHTVAVVRVPYAVKFQLADPTNHHAQPPMMDHAAEDAPCEDPEHQRQDSGDMMIIEQVIDTSIPNPHGSIVDKYWAQRRRLFSRFDQGIQLDEEGWYSVTPEIIADHVAHRVGELSNSAAFSRGLPGARSISETQGIVVLDAFCGCGGNSIAFGKIAPQFISLVICVDVDRTKLRKAAHNASLYDIPKDKLIFVECNTMFILQYCYKNGDFVLDQPSAMGTVMPSLPSPVLTEVYDGYTIGGLNVVPRRIDAVFMDPPWGGVDYEVLGKNGYDLFLNMKIAIDPGMQPEDPRARHDVPHPSVDAANDDSGGGGISDDFFDSFGGQGKSSGNNSKKKQFNNHTSGAGDHGKKFVNGAQLLQLAAAATTSRLVIYDLPRNTNKNSLGQAALDSGYRGNIKLEEHWLNGRLKTVTAYFGADYSNLLHQHQEQQQQPTQTHKTG